MGVWGSKSENAKRVGTMKLYLEKGEYSAGEVVTGRVIVTVDDEVPCDHIVLRFRATEQIIYKSSSSKPKQVFDRVAGIIPIDRRIKGGIHTFSFKYQLPPLLQPSIYVGQESGTDINRQLTPSQLKFSLIYLFLAELEIKDKGKHDLNVLNVIKISSNVNVGRVDQTFVEQLTNCYSRYGIYEQRIILEKNQFHPGEQVHLNIGVINQDLVRLQIFYKGRSKPRTKELSLNKTSIKEDVRGCSAKNNIIVSLKIPQNPMLIQPTYQGAQFAVKYLIKFTFIYPGPLFTTFKSLKIIPITLIPNTVRN